MSYDPALCEECHIHPGRLRAALSAMPEDESLLGMAELFKLFGDATRLRILFLLSQKDICVCDLSAALSMSQSAVSHQLKVLKQGQLVSYRREGKSVFYSLADDHVRSILSQGLDHVNE